MLADTSTARTLPMKMPRYPNNESPTSANGIESNSICRAEMISGGAGLPSALKLDVLIATTPIKPIPSGTIMRYTLATATTSGSEFTRLIK
ncbi:uncharacterized protein METZ01_LOCUS327489 [marine metagenome]|uniref:Uncharacterized protein n=1 Tax=marine metagenome TaxID=408172 RepID=A0A382PPM9_9ZZZZ